MIAFYIFTGVVLLGILFSFLYLKKHQRHTGE